MARRLCLSSLVVAELFKSAVDSATNLKSLVLPGFSLFSKGSDAVLFASFPVLHHALRHTFRGNQVYGFLFSFAVFVL